MDVADHDRMRELLRFFDRMPKMLPVYEAVEAKICAELQPVEIKIQKTQIRDLPALRKRRSLIPAGGHNMRSWRMRPNWTSSYLAG